MTDSPTRVLVTGATGTIGTLLASRLSGDYEILSHGRTPATPEQEEHLLRADLEDYDEVLAMMSGVDVVVHLAGAASPESEWEDVLSANIIGFRNVIEAARHSGVRRFIFASSNHVMGMYDREGAWPVYPSDPPRPDSLYGVSKAFGEVMGRYYHDQFGLQFIALRIGWSTGDIGAADTDVLRAMWLSEDDTEQVVRCAIEADVEFGIYYAVSDNPNRHWDITNTMVDLGFRPRDSWTEELGEPEQVVPGGEPAPGDWPADA